MPAPGYVYDSISGFHGIYTVDADYSPDPGFSPDLDSNSEYNPDADSSFNASYSPDPDSSFSTDPGYNESSDATWPCDHIFNHSDETFSSIGSPAPFRGGMRESWNPPPQKHTPSSLPACGQWTPPPASVRNLVPEPKPDFKHHVHVHVQFGFPTPAEQAEQDASDALLAVGAHEGRITKTKALVASLERAKAALERAQAALKGVRSATPPPHPS